MALVAGVKIVFRVGLVLLKQMLGSVDKLREVQGMYETMERLRSISPDTIREDVLVQEVRLLLFLILLSFRSCESLFPCGFHFLCLVQIVTLPVTEALIERESTVQVRKWRESRGELTHQPGRRLHGTRAIYEYKRRAAAISSGGSFSFLGSSVPPPGPLRSSSSLLSLPGFRKSKAPFQAHKKGSFSGLSGVDARLPQPPPTMTPSQGCGPSQKPPIPPAAGQRAPVPQSPLTRIAAAPALAGTQPAAAAPAANALSPAPKVVSEQITPTIPSPTANNAPLPPLPDPKKEAGAPAGEEEGKKKRRSKEDKKKDKEDEKKKLKEKKEKEKAEKERVKKEKERLEKEKKKGGKKKDKGGGGETEEKNGATAAKDSA